MINYNRGGTGLFGLTLPEHFLLDFIGLYELIKIGYLVVSSNLGLIEDNLLRYSDGGGLQDIQHIEGIVDIVVPSFEKEEVYCIAGSMGVTNTLNLLRRKRVSHERVCFISGNYNERISLADNPQVKKFKQTYYDTENPQELYFRSPLDWFDKLPTKLNYLLLHGFDDIKTPATQAYKFANLAQKNNRVSLHIYPDNHPLREYRADVKRKIVDFITNHK